MHSHSILLVLNGTSLDSINTLQALKWWFFFFFLWCWWILHFYWWRNSIISYVYIIFYRWEWHRSNEKLSAAYDRWKYRKVLFDAEMANHCPDSPTISLYCSAKWHIISWELEGCYHYSKMFCWEPEWLYCHRLCTAIVPFWLSTEQLWIVIAPFCRLSADEIILFDAEMANHCSDSPTISLHCSGKWRMIYRKQHYSIACDI